MTKQRILCFSLFIALLMSTNAGRGGGGRGIRGHRVASMYKPWIHTFISHRNPTSVNYYENKDITLLIMLFGAGVYYIYNIWLQISSNRDFDLTMAEARIVKASHFELGYILGRKITFFCMVTGFPRPAITWLKDGIQLYHHKFFQVHEWPIGNNTLKSKMEIDPATQKDAGYYECQADNQYAVDRRGFKTDYVMISY